MNETVDHLLRKIELKLRKLSRGDIDFYEELRSQVAQELLKLLGNRKSANVGIAIGIAINSASDITSGRRSYRQKFVSISQVMSNTPFPKPISRDDVFAQVWAKLCCEPLRQKVQLWRRSLRPQVRRTLRGLRRGKTQAEMAAVEGVPCGTVASWVSRARRRLDSALAS